MPGPQIARAGLREGGAGEHGQVLPAVGIAHRGIAQEVERGRRGTRARLGRSDRTGPSSSPTG